MATTSKFATSPPRALGGTWTEMVKDWVPDPLLVTVVGEAVTVQFLSMSIVSDAEAYCQRGWSKVTLPWNVTVSAVSSGLPSRISSSSSISTERSPGRAEAGPGTNGTSRTVMMERSASRSVRGGRPVMFGKRIPVARYQRLHHVEK